MNDDWAVKGTYLEACNCEAICPCRSHDGEPGGQSTYGKCEFALSWTVDEGHYGDLDLSGLTAALTGWYGDGDTPAPWRVRCFIDERASKEQHDALAAIYLGNAGGHPGNTYGTVINDVLGIESAEITLTHDKSKWSIGVAGRVEVRASKKAKATGPIICGISGEAPGTEYEADIIKVTDDPFQWEMSGKASFVAPYAYSGS